MGLFDTKPDLPRWCYSLADALTAGKVVDPGSQKKTAGWSDLEKPSFSTFNWFQAQTYLFLGYLNSSVGSLFDQDFVARTSDCEVTHAGATDVDVAAGKVWSGGAFYELAADTLTISGALAGNARIDTVVATASGYVVRVGTATTLPTEPTAPTLTAGDVPLADVYMTGPLLTSVTDVRVHGAFHGDRVRADRFFRAGAQGGGAYNIEVDGDADEVTCQATDWTAACSGTHAVSGDTCTVVGTSAVTVTSAGTFGLTATTSVQINDLTGGPVSIGHSGTTVTLDGTVQVPSAGVDFTGGAVTKHKIIAGCSGASDGGTAPYIDGHQITATGQRVMYDLDLPDGASIVEVTVNCTRVGSTDTLNAQLYLRQATSYASKDTATGHTTIVLAPSSPEVVDRDTGTYVVDLYATSWTGDNITIHSIDVEYTIDGLRAA